MAVTITSTADKEVSIILADAQKKSEIMKGEGDGQRNKIFADAFGKDAEFFAFIRSMEAYGSSFGSGNDMLVLDANSDFFRYLQNMMGKIEE